uniref:hypothetical protein n=1 Tax=Enterocloster clostridioformis TaxID=1531 RepID=UPI00243289B7
PLGRQFTGALVKLRLFLILSFNLILISKRSVAEKRQEIRKCNCLSAPLNPATSSDVISLTL